MASIRIRYFKWRNGRPRWEPGPTVRKQGFKGQNLKDDDNNWLTLPDAIAAAEKLNAELDAFRLGQPAKKKQVYITERTVNALAYLYMGTSIDDPKACRDYRKLALESRKNARYRAKQFLNIFGDAPVAEITKPQMFEFYNRQADLRGNTMAVGMIAFASKLFTFAEQKGWRPAGSNPARNIGVTPPKPAPQIWFPNEINHIIETADTMGHFSIADASIIALHTGQRQSDVLIMPDHIFGQSIKITQMKRGATVDIKSTAVLSSRISEIRTRKAAQDIPNLKAMVISETTGLPYELSHFRHLFLKVKREAMKTMPGLEKKQSRHFRHTAVTRFATAGNDTNRIRAITGHSPSTVHEIMKHYLVLNKEMGDICIDTTEAWLIKEGIKI